MSKRSNTERKSKTKIRILHTSGELQAFDVRWLEKQEIKVVV